MGVVRSGGISQYHSTSEITYSGFILCEFNFVIISAKIAVQNSIMNIIFVIFRVFLQISVLLVEAAMDSKPGRAEDPLFPQKKTQLRMATNQIHLLRWATGQKDNRALLLTVEFTQNPGNSSILSEFNQTRISSILTVHVANNSRMQHFYSQKTLE